MIPAAIIAAIAAGATAWMAHRTAKRNTDKTIAANKEQAQYAYSKDLEMWNRGNEYNTPEAQMQRLSAAKLNPNMIYGSGSSVGNVSGQLPKYNAPDQQYNYKPPMDPASMIAAYQDMAMRQAQVDNLKAQTQNTNVRTDNQIVSGRILGLTEYGKPFENAKLFNEVQKGNIEVGNLRQYSGQVASEQARAGTLQNEMRLKELGMMPDRATSLQLANEKAHQDVVFKQFQNWFMKMGVNSSDHFLVRAMARIMAESGFTD